MTLNPYLIFSSYQVTRHIMSSITWSAVSLTQHCCAMPHDYHASLITHVEHSGTTYIRIPWNASLHTHVLQLVYIVSSLHCRLYSYSLRISIKPSAECWDVWVNIEVCLFIFSSFLLLSPRGLEIGLVWSNMSYMATELPREAAAQNCWEGEQVKKAVGVIGCQVFNS